MVYNDFSEQKVVQSFLLQKRTFTILLNSFLLNKDIQLHQKKRSYRKMLILLRKFNGPLFNRNYSKYFFFDQPQEEQREITYRMNRLTTLDLQRPFFKIKMPKYWKMPDFQANVIADEIDLESYSSNVSNPVFKV